MDTQYNPSPIRRRAYESIRQMVINGELEPGSPVIERELAARLNTSRAPVREALVELEKEGLIRNVGSRIRVVAEATMRDAVELYELREALEGMAARLLSVSASPEQIACLREMVGSMGNGPSVPEDDEIRFHEYIVRECGNRRLAQLADPIRAQWVKIRYHDFLTRAQDRSRRAGVTHEDIVRSIEERDGDLAESLIREHIRQGRENLMQSALLRQ